MGKFDSRTHTEKLRKMDHGVPRGTVSRDRTRVRGLARRPLTACEWQDPQCECEPGVKCQWGINNVIWNARQRHSFSYQPHNVKECVHCGMEYEVCLEQQSKYCA